MIALVLLAAAAAAATVTATEVPYCNAPGVTPPRSANSHAIESSEYPDDALRQDEEGVTIVNILIDETGKPAGTSVLVPSGTQDLDDAAVRLVTSRWLYHPATKDGQPVACLNAARLIWHIDSATTPYGPGMNAPGINVFRPGPDDYPASAKAAKEEGVSAILLTPNGDSADVSVVHSSGHPDLDAAAADRVRARWDAVTAKPTSASILIYSWKLTHQTL
jgi:TonB family protein